MTQEMSWNSLPVVGCRNEFRLSSASREGIDCVISCGDGIVIFVDWVTSWNMVIWGFASRISRHLEGSLYWSSAIRARNSIN
jgi:hypothetical protein